MGRPVRRLIQTLIFAALIAVGGWLCFLRIGDPMPAPEEAPQLLAAADCAEFLGTTRWPEGAIARVTPFHEMAAVCARFVGEGRPNLRMRCYRLFPAASAVLLLMVIPALGLRRRGGVFETADGPLWALAFTAFSPVLVWHAGMFGPFSLLALASLVLLVAARSYAQWPGYLPAAMIGAVSALTVAVEPEVLWVLALLIPAVVIGVGWTRLCLYWRTLHVVLAVTVGVGICSLFAHFGLMSAPSLPVLPGSVSEGLLGIWWRVWWLCSGGLGLIAWFGLAVWGGCRSDRRWARLLAIVFPLCFVGSLFFVRGGAFAVPLACLSPLMAGMALSAIPHTWLRAALGVTVAALLCSGVAWMTAQTRRPSRAVQKAGVATLLGAQDAPWHRNFRVRVSTANPEICSVMLWPIRAMVRHAACADRLIYDDADILIVDERDVGGLPPGIGRLVRPGVVCLGPDLSFRVFAARPSVGKESL